MKHIITLILLCFFMQIIAEESLFTQANQKYKSEDYSSAAILYDSIVSSGFESSEIYYNLGNCSYKIKDWGNAIWYYEKSLLLKKNKKTIENLKLTKLKIIDKIEPLPTLFYENWWNYILGFYSTMIWQIITIICVWLLFITSTVIQSLKFKTINTQLFLLTLSIALVFITHYSNKKNLEISAIILSSTVKVASAPTSNAKKLFLIHSGTKVKIKDQIDNWINVEFSNGNNGWIQESSCRVIN